MLRFSLFHEDRGRLCGGYRYGNLLRVNEEKLNELLPLLWGGVLKLAGGA